MKQLSNPWNTGRLMVPTTSLDPLVKPQKAHCCNYEYLVLYKQADHCTGPLGRSFFSQFGMGSEHQTARFERASGVIQFAEKMERESVVPVKVVEIREDLNTERFGLLGRQYRPVRVIWSQSDNKFPFSEKDWNYWA
jgi:hypothetical protein